MFARLSRRAGLSAIAGLSCLVQSNIATKSRYSGKFFILVTSHFFQILTLKQFKNQPTFAKVTVTFNVQTMIPDVTRQYVTTAEVQRTDEPVNRKHSVKPLKANDKKTHIKNY